MFEKSFNDKKVIFAFTFIIEFILYFFFEHLPIGGEFLIPDVGLAPIFGMMFGPVGGLGQASASFIWQICEGADPIASLIDFSVMFFISILAYKLWYSTFIKKEINTPKFDSTHNLLKFITIMGIVSIIYFAAIVLSFEACPNMYIIYPLKTKIYLVSYVLNMFYFSIIYGLLLVSVFNIKKIPMQSPKKWFDIINIKNKYFIYVLALLLLYAVLVEILNIDNDFTDNVFFMTAVLTTILFCLNKFEAKINIVIVEYTIIEKIILIFLIMLFIMLFLIFDEFEYICIFLMENLNPDFTKLITLCYSTAFVILICIIHVYYIEKRITNPIYDLIDSTKQYDKNRLDVPEDFTSKFKKYLKTDNEVSRLIESFISLDKNIKTHLTSYKNAAAEKERIETEFNIAHNIQYSMLKTDFEEFSKNKPFEIYGFMTPAREVGGDFYDYFNIGDDNVGFVVGDVSGKGVPATLFMVKTMNLIRNHIKFDSGPEETFENVNNLSCMRNDGELFVTSWMGTLNLNSGKLSFVNAGHSRPLIRQNNRDFEYLDSNPNFVLGVVEDIPYEKDEMQLNPGDMVFLYTDGITEANNNYNGFYGETRLKDTLNRCKDEKLSDIIENIKDDVYQHCNSYDQFDDMTMLIIKYNGGENDE